MKKAGVLLLLLVLLGFSAGCIGSNGTTSTSSTSTTSKPAYVDVNGTRIYLNEIHFYMYGMKTCPHCRHMHEWIPQEYGEKALTYYELVDNQTNMMLFNELAQLTGITGVPAIAITYNGTLYAVIEGEFNVTATPQIIATAIKNDGVLLLTGKTYLLSYKDPKAKLVINALYTIFVKHQSVDVQKIFNELKANSTSTGNSTG
ncbi:Thiol-disulfide isomerase and thioredoxins [Thermococcus nautili]|uniref:glutaredoxin family protein n=1 Tax=Thermococcus nautili TaxID=195522 RepID=UPI0025563975|nr:glutaredoxin [Thermococcus nautili]CAI1493953.1 Thiol-disulfide isomerase and thioredoxins [Thermococcus nautili]